MVFDQTSKYLAAKKSQTIAFPAHLRFFSCKKSGEKSSPEKQESETK